MARHRSSDASVPQFSGEPSEEPDRMQMAFWVLQPHVPAFGSVWRVPEDLWKQRIAGYWSEGREFHPGLSLGAFLGRGGHERIDFWYGSSKKASKATFVLKYMPPTSTDTDCAHVTYFGAFKPIGLLESEWKPILKGQRAAYILTPEERSELMTELGKRFKGIRKGVRK